MFTNPSTANLADFNSYAISQGVPALDLPSGALITVSINTSGAITAASMSGTVAAGMVLDGAGIPGGLYLATWSTLSGTVTPLPASAISAASANVYSAYLAWALNYAIEVALEGPAIGAGLAGYAGQYVMATYNLALHQVLKIAIDQTGQVFFSNARQEFGLNSLRAGVVMASEDQGTSQTLVVPEFFHNLTLSELDLLKTPYGRSYLEYAQMYGSSIVAYS